ncbi:MAG: FHA domain-containing protein, partial [Bdellovibrionota bacterium]
MSHPVRIEKEKPKPAEKSAPVRMQAEVLQEGNVSMGSYVTEGEDRFIIGSSKRADLVVPHAAVSQIHAMLRLVDSDILLYDLGSEGGTFVEGKKIVERKLKQGEIFEIGGHRVRVNLLDQLTHESGERALFWLADCTVAPDRLEVIKIENGIVRDERTLLKGARLHFGRGRREMLLAGAKYGDCFLHRKDSGNSHVVEATLPVGYIAEIYNGTNEMVRVIEQEGSAFTFQENEKARLVSADQKREVLILWQAQGSRVARLGVDNESPVLKKTLGTCLAVALFIMTVLSYVPLKKEVVEDAMIPKSSYERISMDSAPAPAQESAQPAKAEGAAAKQQVAQQQPSQAASISSTLAKLLNKKSSVTAETIQQAISNNGTQTARNSAVKDANIKSQDIASGAVGGGSVNVNALSAGLSSGNGAKAGSLNGFANGKGASIGGAGGSGFGGKGFDMSLGGDEAEALGG